MVINKKQKSFFKKNKRGYFFSLDAFLALLVILGVVIFIRPQSIQTTQEMNLQEDLLSVLSSLKIGEIDNSYVKSLISDGSITELNQSVLEQIGEFYAVSDTKAETLTASILNDLNLDESVGLYFNNMEIARHGEVEFNQATDVWTARQIISGFPQNRTSFRGFSARAFLFSKNNIDYVYFGGYVGDGNITINLGKNVSSVKVEAVFSGDFNLSLNNGAKTNHHPTPNVPYELSIISGFSAGENSIEFTSANNLYIAGGFVKIIYSQGEIPQTTNIYKLPGIKGLINIYSGFYIPGTLQNMEVFLNYSSLYKVFLNIGNTRVYTGNSSNAQITLDNSTLAGILDYSEMTEKTIPFRLGLENVSYVLNSSLDADVFSVTDTSGSMMPSCSGAGFWCCFFNGMCRTNSTCTTCGGTWEDKIGTAKSANNIFIDAIIDGGDEHKVGLVGYSTSAPNSSYHALSRNANSLKSKVNSWTATGNTCICCGINKGVDQLNSESTPQKFRSMVVMSDGKANVKCARQNTGNAKQDAIKAACDAYEDYNITVYAVGFGSDTDITTLQSIASCGHGSFYFGNLEDLIEVYQQIADEIINATYSEQTIFGEGIDATLFPSSYISIDYSKNIPYGLLIIAETEEFGASTPIGSFSLPSDATPYEIRVVSYSGSKWTSKVAVYNNITGTWENVFDLSEYNLPFTQLGDPYVINIPLNKVKPGNNLVNVSLGLAPNNFTAGSQYNKVIYSVLKNVSSYSPIVSSADGCIWTIEFEDLTNTTMKIPSDYNGTDTCSYALGKIVYNNNDAIDYAIYNLLLELDLNSNSRVETKFSNSDLTIDSLEVEGIPFVWETEVQARVWR